MKTILNNILGNKKGLLSIIAEQGVGKISFKRSFAIVVATYVFTVHVPANGGLLDLWAILGLAVAGLTVALPQMFNGKA